MKYYYLKKSKLKNNQIYIVKQTSYRLENFQDVLGNDIIEYQTSKNQNIPNNWGYCEDSEELFDKDLQPSPFHNYRDGKWIIVDIRKYKIFVKEKLKNIKNKKLTSPIYYKNKYIQVRNQEDIDNLKDAELTGQTTNWITLDNSLIVLQNQDFNKILKIYRERKNNIYNQYITEINFLNIKNKIEILEEHFKYLMEE